MDRSDILLVGQTPPPYHGQAVVTNMLFEHDWQGLKVECLRMAFSDNIESVGEASWVKIWKLVVLVLKTWKRVSVSQPKVLYYLPASPNLTPVIRDVVYLGLVRWLFPQVVFHFHAGGLDKLYSERKWLRRLTKFVYDGVDCSIDVNITTPPSGEYFQAKRNEVVMNGLDVEQATRGRGDDGEFYLLYVGLLCEEKGVMELPQTAKLLLDLGCVCKMVLVGGWESDEFKHRFMEEIQELEVSHFFAFEGVKQGADKWQAFADADAYIFPSHHPTETFGLVLLEAMAFRLPIITNRWRGIPHVVGEEGCAILCEPRCPEDYAKAIARLINSPELCQQMGDVAHIRYRERFTKDQFLDRMEQVFADVLNKRETS
jgi:glycosyltransferase involved in cell wall biosynthesis